MLSPDTIAPKIKTPSIYSYDSGYGSYALEDEDLCPPSAMIGQLPFHQQKQTIGLGISDIWNIDPRRLQRTDAPVGPVTTKVHVFPVRIVSQDDMPVGGANTHSSSCVSCQLWTISNPGQGSTCNSCRGQDFVKPGTIHGASRKLSFKQLVPRLEIPQDPQPNVSFGLSRTRCSACELARNTGLPACSRCTRDPDLLSPISPVDRPAVRRSCAKRPTKLPPSALKHLRSWLQANQHDPYPNAETKRTLAHQCGISEKQVNTWFTNTRARKLAMPSDKSYSSSDDECVYDSGISSRADTPVCPNNASKSFGPSINCAVPTTDYSIIDTNSLSPQTSRRGKKKDYRRLNNTLPIEESPVTQTSATPSPRTDGTEQQMWQCTFCHQHLVPKSWRRHEETQHRPKHQWTCLATGPRLTIAHRSGTYSMCAFCQMKNPDENHFLHSHRILECSKKSEAERTFGRPDHLRQHIKNFHKCSLLEYVRDMWRRDGPGKNVNEGWRCGFCGDELKTWDIRETHIANHFKEGATMATWSEYTLASSGSSSDNEQTLTPSILDHSFQNPHGAQRQEQTPPPQMSYARSFQPVPNTNSYSTTVAPPTLSLPGLDTSFANLSGPFDMDFDFSDLSATPELDMMFPSPVHGMDGFPNPLEQPFDPDAFPDMDMNGHFMQGWNGQ